ncbi:beta-xylosidase [Bradyrhizobium sp. USDA 4469]
MIEAAKIWNEPNNKSHWDLLIDPDWAMFANLAIAAGKAIRSTHPALPIVLGGISPIDPSFMRNMQARGVLGHFDAVAVHGFPLDWNLWQIGEWPDKIEEIKAVTTLPVWVTEVGGLLLRRRGGAGLGPVAHRRTSDRPRAPRPLVQPL